MEREIIRPGDPGIRRGRCGDGLAHLGTGILPGGGGVMDADEDGQRCFWLEQQQQQQHVNSSHSN